MDRTKEQQMKYYKAQTDMYEPSTKWTLIKNELVTESERKKRFPTLPDFLFKEVDIPKYNTYISFGTRFQTKENYNGR